MAWIVAAATMPRGQDPADELWRLELRERVSRVSAAIRDLTLALSHPAVPHRTRKDRRRRSR